MHVRFQNWNLIGQPAQAVEFRYKCAWSRLCAKVNTILCWSFNVATVLLHSLWSVAVIWRSTWHSVMLYFDSHFHQLGRAWVSPTLAGLLCRCVCVCIYAILLGPTTYCKFQMSTFKYFMPWWLHVLSTPTCTSAEPKPWERAWRATARLQVWREGERERRRLKLNALIAHTATYFLKYATLVATNQTIAHDSCKAGCKWQRMYGGKVCFR